MDEAVEKGRALVDQAEADLVGHDLVVEDPLLRLGNGHRLGQQVVHLDDVDAAVAHLRDEVEVVALGVLHPQHVVEQQLVAVGRREALVRAARRADQDLAQLPDLGVDAELRLALLPFAVSILVSAFAMCCSFVAQREMAPVARPYTP